MSFQQRLKLTLKQKEHKEHKKTIDIRAINTMTCTLGSECDLILGANSSFTFDYDMSYVTYRAHTYKKV